MELNLSFVRSVGKDFTWSKRGDGEKRIYSKIDHCLGDSKWMSKYGKVIAHFLFPGLSDHSPIVVKIKVFEKGDGGSFRFLNHMADHRRSEDIAMEEWSKHMGRIDLESV